MNTLPYSFRPDKPHVLHLIATTLGRPTKGAFRRAFSKLAANVLQPRGKPRATKGQRPTQTQKAAAVRATHKRKLPSRSSLAAPVAVATTIRNTVPRVRGNMFGAGGMTITHREFCFDVNSESKYSPVRVPIQPGSSEFTRWLSNIAPWFESYILHSLTFDYVPSISTGRDGRMILGVDYDANDATPNDIHILENLGDNASGSVWAPLTLRCTPANLHKMVKERYVRTASVMARELTTTDSGNFFLAIDGAGSEHDGTKLGAIYVTYTISLRTPQVHAISTQNLNAYSYKGTIHDLVLASNLNYGLFSSTYYDAWNSPTTNRWGDGSLLQTNSVMPIVSDQIILPVGAWDISATVVGRINVAFTKGTSGFNFTGLGTPSQSHYANQDDAGAASALASYRREVYVVTQDMVTANLNKLSVAYKTPTFSGGTIVTTTFSLSVQPHLSASPAYADPEQRIIDRILAQLKAKPEALEHKDEKKGYFF